MLGNIFSLAELKKKLGTGPVIRVNTILMQNNIEKFDEFYKALADCGVKEISLNGLGGGENSIQYNNNQIKPDQVLAFQRKAKDIVKSSAHGPEILGTDQYFKRLYLQVSNIKVPVMDCKPGREYLFIDENGGVGPCAYTTSNFNANIREIDSAEGIIELSNKLSAVKSREMFPACLDCPSTNIFGKFEKQE